MLTPGFLPLAGNRNTPFVATLPFPIDLTDAVMKAQVRDRKDGGTLRAELLTVETVNTEGFRLISVTTVGSVTTSLVAMRINKATMQAMPKSSPVGDDMQLYWDMAITPDGGVQQIYVRGPFTVWAGVTQ